MKQRALATLLCLIGAAGIALGIASATAWRADDVLVASAQAAPGTTLVVTDPGVLDLAAESVTVRATADSRVVIALGRTQDVEAWVGGDAHTRVTGLARWHELAVTNVAAQVPEEPEGEATEGAAEGEAAAPTDGADAATGDQASGDEATAEGTGEPEAAPPPDPSGSDLWVAQVSADDEVEFEWIARDGRWSVLIAAVGEDAGPPTVSLAWPQVVTTPYLWPGVLGGGVLLLAGLAWWARMLVKARRARREVDHAEAEPEPAGAPQQAGVPVGASRQPGVAPSTTPAPSAPAATTAAGPAVPMTRRQLRELEEQRRARGGRGRGRRAERPAEPEQPAAGPRTPTAPAAHTATRASVPATAPAAPAAPGAPSAGRSAPAWPAASAPPSWPATQPGRSAQPGQPAQPAAPAGPAGQWTPTASADAWRRAWGLPPAEEPRPHRDAPEAPPLQPDDQPAQPGWPPVRRRDQR